MGTPDGDTALKDAPFRNHECSRMTRIEGRTRPAFAKATAETWNRTRNEEPGTGTWNPA
jgi:hypothetical protein